ncbi:hypothetical protein ACHQM5_028350 [Ranunculus cassubicifolius]
MAKSSKAGSSSKPNTKTHKLFWVKKLVATNVSPKFSLTIPAEAWRKIHVPLRPGMPVLFSEGYGECWEGKLVFEAEEKKKGDGRWLEEIYTEKKTSSW